jgi:hypothetical protein
MDVYTLRGINSSSSWAEIKELRDALAERASQLNWRDPEKTKLVAQVKRINDFAKSYRDAAVSGDITEVEPLNGGIGKGFLKKVFKGVKKVAMALPRNSYMALVDFNVRGVATKLSKALAKDPSKIQALWERLGGNFSKFKNAINNGKNKKPFLGSKLEGIAGPELAAALAAAAPIIATVGAYLKKIFPGDASVNTDELTNAASQAGGKTTPYDENTVASDGESGFLSTTTGKVIVFGGGGLVAAKLLKII